MANDKPFSASNSHLCLCVYEHKYVYLTFQCSRRQIKIDFSALTNKEIAAQICIHRARNSQSIAESNIEKTKDERQKKVTYKNKKKKNKNKKWKKK